MSDSLGAWVIWLTYGGFLLYFFGLGIKSVWEIVKHGPPVDGCSCGTCRIWRR